MTHYVVGFAFGHGGNVALIVKNRPEWQRGRMNGIGGKIEPGEMSDDAMVREFYEETGRLTRKEVWEFFATLSGAEFSVAFFYTYLNNLEGLQSPTDENVVVVPIESINATDCIPNVTWLIPMALSMDYDNAQAFVVTEV